jgi:predicted membrane channel-forming protein YqfA (hemolysin III family)
MAWNGIGGRRGVVYTLGILFFAYAIPQRARVWWER